MVLMLAGGDGKRFWPLTRIRAKGAVPLAGNFRLIDVPLSNVINSSFRKHCYIMVQANPNSLINHLDAYSDAAIGKMTSEFIQVVTPNAQRGFYKSDAHSLQEFQQIWQIADCRNKYDFVIIMMSDQIIKVDLWQVVEELLRSGADLAMVYTLVNLEEARGKLGVLQLKDKRVIELEEKPPEPAEYRSGKCCGNLALYVMKRRSFEQLMDLTKKYDPVKSLSRGVLPELIDQLDVIGYDLAYNQINGEAGQSFFQDIESADTLVEFSQELWQTEPRFNFHDENWPIYTAPRAAMPSKFGNFSGTNFVLGYNVICEDNVRIRQAIISRNSVIKKNSQLDNSLVFDNALIGRNCVLERVIVDKAVEVPDNTSLNPDSPLAGKITLTEYTKKYDKKPQEAPPLPVLTPKGYLVIPKGYVF